MPNENNNPSNIDIDDIEQYIEQTQEEVEVLEENISSFQKTVNNLQINFANDLAKYHLYGNNQPSTAPKGAVFLNFIN